MIKEELKKEAIKYAVDYPTSYGKGYKHKDLRIAYLAGAQPREKRIEELEQLNSNQAESLRIIMLEEEKKNRQIEELEKDKAYAEEQLDEQIQATLKLQKENRDLADFNSRLLSQAAAATKRVIQLEKENADLEEKINILENCDRLGDTITEVYKEQLAQAKEIIKGLLDLPDLIQDRTSEHTELIGRAEQFLEEEA